MAHTDVEKINGFVIRKLHSPDRTKVYGFLTLPAEYDGSDIGQVKRAGTLTEARQIAGFVHKPVTPMTPPKSANPQNRKGYRADSTASKKK